MKASRAMLAAGGALGIVAAFFWAGHRAQGAASPPDADAIRRLEQQISDLQEAQGSLQKQVLGSTGFPPAGSARSTTAPAKRLPGSGGPPEPKPRMPPNEVVGRLEERLRSEARDPNWSERTEKQIESVFADPSLGDLELLDDRCGATLCRIEIGYDGEGPLAPNPTTRLASHAPFNQVDGVFRKEQGQDGKQRMVFLFARPKYSLKSSLDPVP
jgi:hypothetical protein